MSVSKFRTGEVNTRRERVRWLADLKKRGLLRTVEPTEEERRRYEAAVNAPEPDAPKKRGKPRLKWVAPGSFQDRG